MGSRIKHLVGRHGLGRDLRTAAVAVVVSGMVMATPSVASMVTNADKVDGKHAVSAGASVSQRAGKLVATSKQGYLPDNILKKARDADRLDGLDSSALVPVVAKPESVQTGVYGAFGDAGYNASVINFRSKLPGYVGSGRYTLIPSGGPYTADCPAPGEVATVEWLCFYTTANFGATLEVVGSISPPSTGASADGFYINFDCSGVCFTYGTWAVRAPAAGQPPRRPGVSGASRSSTVG